MRISYSCLPRLPNVAGFGCGSRTERGRSRDLPGAALQLEALPSLFKLDCIVFLKRRNELRLESTLQRPKCVAFRRMANGKSSAFVCRSVLVKQFKKNDGLVVRKLDIHGCNA